MANLVNFSPLTWINKVTKRNAANFNRMETGIKDCANAINSVNNNLSNQNSALTKLWVGNDTNYVQMPISNYKFIIIVQGEHISGNDESLHGIKEYRMIPTCGMDIVGANYGFNYTSILGDIRFRGDSAYLHICTTNTSSFFGVYGLN